LIEHHFIYCQFKATEGRAVGCRTSYADISIWHLIEETFEPQHASDVSRALENCPKLRSIVKKIGENPKLQAYLERRPKTMF
jgi:hypothetical protein